MAKTLRSSAVFVVAVALMCTVPARPRAADRFPLNPGDHICIIGNTLADRMQHDGWLETMLHARFPNHKLVIRNLGFSGDEVAGFTSRPDANSRLRSQALATAAQWLAGSAPFPEPNKLVTRHGVRDN